VQVVDVEENSRSSLVEARNNLGNTSGTRVNSTLQVGSTSRATSDPSMTKETKSQDETLTPPHPRRRRTLTKKSLLKRRKMRTSQLYPVSNVALLQRQRRRPP